MEKLAVLDIIPTIETWERMDRQRGLASYHWYFLAQPHDFPERLIGAAPEAFVRYTLESWCRTPDVMSEEALTEYVSHFCLPETIHATCEDYRAGATVDVQHDEADRSNQRRITCPTLVLWGEQGHAPWDHLAVWQCWANDVRGGGLPCGHFLPEEAPEALLGALQEFV